MKLNAMKVQNHTDVKLTRYTRWYANINQTAIGSVGFDCEIVSIRNGKKVKKVLLTYDSFASHTSMDVSLKNELQLNKRKRISNNSCY